RQHGVVTRAQLLSVGLGPDAVDKRLRSGRLHRLHRGVYLLGHAVAALHACELAAVLACGEGAALSHGNAAHVWRLLAYPAAPTPISVTVVGRNPGARPGIQ